jgi:hypothetical protein
MKARVKSLRQLGTVTCVILQRPDISKSIVFRSNESELLIAAEHSYQKGMNYTTTSDNQTEFNSVNNETPAKFPFTYLSSINSQSPTT